MRASEMAGIVMVVIAFIIAINLYPDMPDQMPGHWNAAGEVDGYLPKFWGLFLFPIIILAIYALFMGLQWVPSLIQNIRSIRKQYDVFMVIIVGFFLYIYVLTILWVFGIQFGFIRMLVPAFAALIFAIGSLVSNVKRNRYIGIRTPWTMGSDRVWEKTHRLAAKLYMLAGIVSLAGMLFESYYALAFLIGPIIIVSAYAMAYSYFEYKKGIRKLQ